MTENQKVKLPNFIEEILALAEKGDFSSNEPEFAIAEGEKVVDDMNAFEKACFVYSFDIAD